MNITPEKIELLKKALPEIYELVLNITSLLEKDLEYVKNLSKDEIEKLDNEDPASFEVDLKLASIQKRASEARDKLKESIENCRILLGLKDNASLANVLLSKELCEILSFNEQFIASAVAKTILKIKN